MGEEVHLLCVLHSWASTSLTGWQNSVNHKFNHMTASGTLYLVVLTRISELEKKYLGIKEVYFHSTMCIKIFYLKLIGKIPAFLFAF